MHVGILTFIVLTEANFYHSRPQRFSGVFGKRHRNQDIVTKTKQFFTNRLVLNKNKESNINKRIALNSNSNAHEKAQSADTT